MTRLIAAVVGVLALAALLAMPLAADARSGHATMSSNHSGSKHHRFNRFYPYAPYYYYGYGYDYGANYVLPPPPSAVKPQTEKTAAEAKRGCEPQTYSVPSAAGGESQVTVLRC